jgi:ABC-2 type transport system ATP-binding protein
MAEHLVVIGHGRLLADTSVGEMSAGAPSLEAAFLELSGTGPGTPSWTSPQEGSS